MSSSDQVPDSPTPAPAQSPAPSGPRQRFSLFNVLIVVVPIALAVGGVAGWYWLEARKEADKVFNPGPNLKHSIKSPEKLDARFVDADNDMVADAPTNPKEWVDPDDLVFATFDVKKDAEIWGDFIAHLKKVTGKKYVKLVPNQFDRKEQFEPLARGELHVLALNSGEVQSCVNYGGFVPVCVMADQSGHWGYRMEIIVPKDSPMKTLQDMRGSRKKVAIANFASHSGYKLLVVTLFDNGFLYERDYDMSIVGGQRQCMKAIRDKQCDVAGVASDFLTREIVAGQVNPNAALIRPDDYRTIFKSGMYPPACFGYAHNLKPELAEKIRKAFLDFNWAGTSLEKGYKDANQVKFVPINYQKDWAGIRETELRLRQVAEQKP